MKRRLLTLTCCTLLTLPCSVFAAESGNHIMETGGHAGMQMTDENTIMLGEQTVDGIKGMAHITDVGEVMTKMGKKENYHFMMIFSDAKTGDAMNQGTVAVKITEPGSGQAGTAIPLMGMGGHFGADVALISKGEYHFTVGTKLTDGKKRQFTFDYTVK